MLGRVVVVWKEGEGVLTNTQRRINLTRRTTWQRYVEAPACPQMFSSNGRRQMGQERESAAAEVERVTKLRDEAEKGSAEHRELNHLIKARRRLYEIEWGKRTRR
jgi:hypothetical protein